MIATIIATVVALSMVACGADADRELSNEYIIIHQYRGLEVTEVVLPEITDDDVESAIQRELMQGVIHQDITNRPARIGDLVTIDFAGSIDGVFFDGGTAQGTQLHLGAGAFIGPYGNYDGFEEQIVGHNVGDSFDITVQFPHDYSMFAHGAEHLDGAVAIFNITLHAITETIIPELTDEWVQENSRSSTTVAEYRDEIRKQMEDSNRIGVLFRQQHEVFTALMEHVEVIEIPQWVIDNEVAIQESLYRNMAAAEGFEYEEFLREVLRVDETMFREQLVAFAMDNASLQLAIELIKERNNLALSDEEMHNRIEELAILSGHDSAQEYIEWLGIEVIHSTIIQLRVAEFLIEHAVMVEDLDGDAVPVG